MLIFKSNGCDSKNQNILVIMRREKQVCKIQIDQEIFNKLNFALFRIGIESQRKIEEDSNIASKDQIARFHV